MLSAIETRLAAVVKAGLPSEMEVYAGPSTGPTSTQQERVEVSATDLSLGPLDDPAAARSPAFLVEMHELDADGAALDFALPGNAKGEVVEVEAPPGMPMRHGDDYLVSGRTIRFYRPPPAGQNAVRVTLSVEPAAGFQERRPCAAQVVIAAWAKVVERADELLRAALGAALVAAVAPRTVEAPQADPRVRLRLVRPTLVLQGVAREPAKLGTRTFFKITASCLVRGELELTVALGAAEPPRTIREIIYARPDTGPK